MNFGLKVWSINKSYVAPAEELLNDGYCDFLEIYFIPWSLKESITSWEKVCAPIIVHAPHYAHGMNLAQNKKKEENIKLYMETAEFATSLGVDEIIVHCGNNGTLDELIKQIQLLDDDRILVENKPLIGQDDQVCVGITPEDISRVIIETGAAFCLDINHAIQAATTMGKDHKEFLSGFIQLSPVLYHLCDSYMRREKDIHLNIGEGDYDFSWILPLLPVDSRVTIETPKASEINLDDYRTDIERLRLLIN